MQVVLTHRGREVTLNQVEDIKATIAQSPTMSRRALSIAVCHAWQWMQPNGTACDALCRGLLLALERAGHIRLPEPRWYAKQPRRHSVVHAVQVDDSAVTGSLSELGPIEIRQVRRTPEEAMVKSLLATHHYLGYVHPVGEHLKYLISAQGRPIACMSWSSAARHLGARDRYIGWSPEARKANIRFVAYQTRFLILPWVRVPHLASHILGAISRRLSEDWQKLYHHPIYFTETFVDVPRYPGTCYRAANWTVLGLTTGRGKDAPTSQPNRSIKTLLGYPLVKNFRQRLCACDTPS